MAEKNNKALCSICGELEAVIFVKIVSDNGVEEKGLCASCAAKYLENKEDIKELNLVDERLTQVIEEMKDLLAGIVANISAISVIMNNQNESTESTCSNCGMTFEEFKESGRLGCPYCYSSFHTYIEDFVFELERGSTHKGRMPEKFARLYVFKKELQFLNTQLKRMVDTENYEQAEIIRRRLEKLIGNYKTGRTDEIN